MILYHEFLNQTKKQNKEQQNFTGYLHKEAYLKIHLETLNILTHYKIEKIPRNFAEPWPSYRFLFCQYFAHLQEKACNFV